MAFKVLSTCILVLLPYVHVLCRWTAESDKYELWNVGILIIMIGQLQMTQKIGTVVPLSTYLNYIILNFSSFTIGHTRHHNLINFQATYFPPRNINNSELISTNLVCTGQAPSIWAKFYNRYIESGSWLASAVAMATPSCVHGNLILCIFDISISPQSSIHVSWKTAHR